MIKSLLSGALILLLFQCSNSPQPPSSANPLLFDYREKPATDHIQLSPDLSVPAEDAGYTLLMPNDSIKGMIVLFHSGRDTTHQGYETRLYTDACRYGLAVLYVTTGNPFEFLFHEKAFEQLDRYIGDVLSKYPIPADQLLFGGMSLAGTRALKFAHWCQAGHSNYNIQPRAIALCDAPLDFTRFWEEAAFTIRYDIHPVAVNEAKWVNAEVEKNLGGTPIEVPEAYMRYSPFVKGPAIDPRLEKMTDIAIRAYTEPAIHWWMNNRNKDYYGTNSVDAAALIRDLRLLGNKEAELVTTQDKGYRPDGSRHPHSWSIVDNEELVRWFLAL